MARKHEVATLLQLFDPPGQKCPVCGNVFSVFGKIPMGGPCPNRCIAPVVIGEYTYTMVLQNSSERGYVCTTVRRHLDTTTSPTGTQWENVTVWNSHKSEAAAWRWYEQKRKRAHDSR